MQLISAPKAGTCAPSAALEHAFSAWRAHGSGRRVDGTHWKRHLPTTALVSATAINEFYLRPVDY